jgi:dihydroorotate dehydrogenase (fumarate)
MDLSTTYLGLKLKNPVVPSASPLSKELDTIKEMEDAGAAAVVMYSLFEEQIKREQQEMDYFFAYGTDSFAEALTYFPKASEYRLGPEEYLEHLRQVKEAVDIPIIGSLNGVSPGGWMDYAKKMQEAGADALELNIYYIPTDPRLPPETIEKRYLEDFRAAKKGVSIPVAMKLSPYFTNMAYMAKQLDDAGVKGLVLFNRFYQPDLDLEKLEVVPDVTLSTSADMRLPLRWIAILYGRIRASLAATSGIHTAADVIKMIMAGADVAMMCSALLQHGPGHIKKTIEGITQWMTEHEYESISEIKGLLSQKKVAEPAAFERANYMKAINRYEYKLY